MLGGKALEGFSSRGFDDHTKVFSLRRARPLFRPLSPMKASTGATACARRRVTIRPCSMRRKMSWCWISSFMMAALPATGR
ncbi:hypothetical protein ACP3P6_05190 [Enterobacter mori]